MDRPGAHSAQRAQSAQSAESAEKAPGLVAAGAIVLACVAVASVFSASSATSARSASSAPATQEFKSRVDLVNVGVTITHRKGNLVTDLTGDDFEIFEDGKKQSLRYFATGEQSESAPEMHLGLMLDVSGSMEEDIAFTRTAAVRFLNTLTDALDITVVDFDTEVRLARYSQNEFARLIERIRRMKTDGLTALYDAMGLYLDGASAQDGRKIMLIYTDGGDTRSAIGLHELMDLLKASDVTVYPIGALEHQSSSVRTQQRMVLQSMADATGGQAFFPTHVKELDGVYEKVVAQIRAQYTLGYLSTNEKTDGTWRKVEVKTTRKDLRVRSRKGYFAVFKKH